MIEAPDTDAIDALLSLVEAETHRHGWDYPPSLRLLYDARDRDTDRHYRRAMPGRWGPRTRLRDYVAIPACPTQGLAGYASHGLFRMALNLQTDDPRVEVVLNHMRAPGFLGMAFCAEGWLRTAEPGQLDRLLDEGRRFADIPGSLESRFITAVDIAGTNYRIGRIRGKDPEIEHDGDFEGSVVESLRAIVAVIAGLPVPTIVNHPSGWKWEDQVHIPNPQGRGR